MTRIPRYMLVFVLTGASAPIVTGGSRETAPITSRAPESRPRLRVGKPKRNSPVAPAFSVKGWAIDRAAPSGTGVDTVRIFVKPIGARRQIRLGRATLGIGRRRVGERFGDQFKDSGFRFDVDPPLPVGSYKLKVRARSTVTGRFKVLARRIQVTVDIELRPIVTGLFRPVGINHAGDGSGRLFITQQDGKILIYDGTQLLPTPFLDIHSLVSCCGERGLLSVAFHPNFAVNRYFYVNYTDLEGATVVARYRVDKNDPNTAEPGSARTLLRIEQPFSNHNGGQLQFGPDGFLYIGMGDGGSGGDPGNRGQALSTLHGKMLRIDVDQGLPYVVPPSNPFLGRQGAREEIWALGLRNPWRFSFDRMTGDLYIGDVGQSSFEEIDFQPADSPGGENYGWRLMEGHACFKPPSGCNDGTLTLPIVDYVHGGGRCSVTGGYVYRGSDIDLLPGTYLYGDFCSGQIWGAARAPDGTWTSVELLQTPYLISSFGEDAAGELYLAHLASGEGKILKLVAP